MRFGVIMRPSHARVTFWPILDNLVRLGKTILAPCRGECVARDCRVQHLDLAPVSVLLGVCSSSVQAAGTHICIASPAYFTSRPPQRGPETQRGPKHARRSRRSRRRRAVTTAHPAAQRTARAARARAVSLRPRSRRPLPPAPSLPSPAPPLRSPLPAPAPRLSRPGMACLVRPGPSPGAPTSYRGRRGRSWPRRARGARGRHLTRSRPQNWPLPRGEGGAGGALGQCVCGG